MSKEITIRVWVKRGIMLINTYALNGDDPDHPYNQALAQGVRPEDFGLERGPMPPTYDPHTGMPIKDRGNKERDAGDE